MALHRRLTELCVTLTDGRADSHSTSHLPIGNKNNLTGGCATYASFFTAFYNVIHVPYPSITIVASTSDTSCLSSPLPEGVRTGIHQYEEPSGFISVYSEWDNVPHTNRLGTFVGEYANTTDDSVATTY
jgi:alpha-N-arabinofuranosidase